ALAAAGIACAPLRGAALAERLYDHASARPAGDIDLLVRKTDLDAVEATLAALGFSAIDRRPGFAREFSYTLELARDAHGGVVVEPPWTRWTRPAGPRSILCWPLTRAWTAARASPCCLRCRASGAARVTRRRCSFRRHDSWRWSTV